MTASTRDYLVLLFRDAGTVELRHQVGKRWDTTWHTDLDDLLATAGSKANEGNLFTSLNRIEVVPDGPVCNDDVTRYCRILFDFDPERPTGTASTEAELVAAKARADGLRHHLAAHGWPPPAVAMSGNGYHLQYRTALPNTDEIREQLASIYAGLHRRFADAVVGFDRTVRNAGRICTLYGTVKRKGPGTTDHPHRQSWIAVPHEWRQVHPRMVARLADGYAREAAQKAPRRPVEAAGVAIASGAGDYASLDVVALFQAHGLYVRHIRDHIHAVRCPWTAEHSTESPQDGGDTVIFEMDGGWPGFFCHHHHCAGRNIRDVIAMFPDADHYCARTFERRAG